MLGLPRTIAAIFFVVATMAAAHAVEAPVCGANCPADIPPNDPAVQATMPGCAVWTDRCVTCQRAAGEVNCSNIGIACQPQALACLRAEPTEVTPKDDKPAEPKKPGN